MQDKARTKAQLLNEIEELRRRNAELEEGLLRLERTAERLREEKERFGSIADYTYDWENWVGPDGRLIWVNPSVERMTGYSVEECHAMDDFPMPMIADPDKERTAAEFARAVTGTVSGRFDFSVRCKNGTTKWASVMYQPIYDASGEYLGHRSSIRDITSRKVAEENLRHERNLLQTVMNASRNTHLVYLDRNFNFVRVNEAYAATCGYRPEEMIGKNHFALYPHPENEAIFTCVRDTGKPFEVRDRPFVFPDQPERGVTYWDWTLIPEKDASGDVTGLIFSLVETTERKRNELMLRESEERFRSAFDRAAVPMTITAIDNRLLFANAAICEMLGYSETELSEGTFYNVTHPDDHAANKAVFDPVRRGEKDSCSMEKRYVRKDGEVLWGIMSTSSVRDENGKPLYFVTHVQDITERKRAEEEIIKLAKSEREKAEKIAALLDSVPIPVFIANDPDCVHLSSNKAATDLLFLDAGSETSLSAPDPVRPVHFRTFKDGRELELSELPAQRAARGEIIKDFDFNLVFEDGTIRNVLGYATPLKDDQGLPCGAVHVLFDITRLKQAERALRESEERLSIATSGAGIGVYQWDIKRNEVYWTEQNDAIFGYTPRRSTTTTTTTTPENKKYDLGHFTDRIHPDELPRLHHILNRSMEEHLPLDAEYRIVWPDGSLHWVQDRGIFSYDEQGEAVSLLGVGVDITERKQAEEELSKAVTMLRKEKNAMDSIFKAVPIGLAMVDDKGENVLSNAEFENVWGSPRPKTECLDDYHHYKAWWPDGTVVETEQWASTQAIQEGRTVINQELEIMRFDGTRAFVLNSAVPIYDSGKVTGAAVSIMDISERKRVEKRLRESEGRLKFVLNNSLDAAYQRNLQQDTYDYISPVIGLLTGYSPEEMNTFDFDAISRLIHPDDLPLMQKEVELTSRGDKETGSLEYRFLAKDGKYRWLADRFSLLRDKTGEPLYRVGMVRDVTERRQMEEALRKYRDELEDQIKERTAEVARLAAVVENSINGIVLTRDFTIVFVNPAFCDLTGYSEQELVGKNLSMLRSAAKPEAYYEEGRHKAAKNDMGVGVWTIQRKDGTTVELETSLSKIADDSIMAFICQDITEKMELEEQLRQAQKMEAIGTLAGGIAHDFNNILAAIIGFTEMAMEDVPDPPLVQKDLQYVMTAAIRARELVKQILAFSRKTGHERVAVVVAPIVRETAALLRATIPATVDMTLSVNASTGTVMAAPIEIQQIIMNLATNALFAMQNQQGSLEMVLSDIDFEPDVVTSDGTSREYLQIMVKDTGVGMAPEVMKRIFEPFFTTREVGKGTGMGLAVVYGIVKDLGGMVTVESEPGRGSTFRVFLPKAGLHASDETKQTALPRGDERILFVDDEPLLLQWGKDTLERLGYKVTAAEDGEQALGIFSAAPSLFDLVITDQAMPKISGSDLGVALLNIRSDIPIVLCTGHSETISPERAQQIGIRQFLMKPVTRQELASTVRRVLDGVSEKD